MRRIKGGILKCIDSIRWVIPRLIDSVLPYQFLSNQLKDCTHGDQFSCPTCKDAIEERIASGRVTVHGVAHRIAMFESNRDWKITYFEMYPAVKEALYGAINRHVAFNSVEGTYHKVLRKGVDMLNKGRKWIGLAILVVGLSHLAIHHGVPAWNEYKADVAAKNEAYQKDTFMGRVHVDNYYMDYNGDLSDFDGKVPMCNRCKHTIGSWSNPAHGHTLTINPMWYEEPHKYDQYVRTCSSE